MYILSKKIQKHKPKDIQFSLKKVICFAILEEQTVVRRIAKVHLVKSLYYCKCYNLIGCSTRYLFIISIHSAIVYYKSCILIGYSFHFILKITV